MNTVFRNVTWGTSVTNQVLYWQAAGWRHLRVWVSEPGQLEPHFLQAFFRQSGGCEQPTCAGQVDLHTEKHARRMDPKNLAVELAVVHRTGFESAPGNRLPGHINSHKTGKSLLPFG